MSEQDKTHFGYTDVSPTEKTERVREVFESVADNYDVTKLDDDLNIIWERFFHIDGGFWLHSIEATDDGGCVILGEVAILGKYHIILLKTDENGSINGINDKLSDKITKELILYPNPGNEQLNIRTTILLD